MNHASNVGDFLMSEFNRLKTKYDIIGDVRGEGFFIGVDLVKDRSTREANPKAAEHVISRLREEKILLQSDGPGNNVLKFKSPMVFQKEDAER